MELAGLEPATSWVRSRRSPALSVACLQGFSQRRKPGPWPALSANFRPFRLGSGQRNGSLARSLVRRATPAEFALHPRRLACRLLFEPDVDGVDDAVERKLG
jgi:hypothetical protein